MDGDQLVIEYRSECSKYRGDLVIDVDVLYDGPFIVGIYIDPSIPLTNENIDKLVNFFNQFRS
jgi:hypothetical protein